MTASSRDRRPFRGSQRADFDELHHALNSPSPLGGILDDIHRSHSTGGDTVESPRYNLSPGIRNQSDGTLISGKSDYSIFGGGSVAYSVVSTIVDGVHHTIAHWKVLLFGQVISFFLALAGAANEELNGTCRVSIPLTQTAIVGGVLMLIGATNLRGWCAGCCSFRGANKVSAQSAEEESFCGGDNGGKSHVIRTPLHKERDDGDELSFDGDQSDTWEMQEHPVSKLRDGQQLRSFCFGLQSLHAPWWSYFLAGLVAVEARYFIFLSFRYTTFTFIYLVDALAIPCAMAFSKCLLDRSYLVTHVLGGFICIIGIVVSTISDLKGHDIENIGSRTDVDSFEHLWGDMLAICGAVLLGLDDVISEVLIKKYGDGGVNELLFAKWFWGLGIAVVQLVFLEVDDLIALFNDEGGQPCSTSTELLLLGGYAVFQVLDMYCELRFLSISEAALLNLSLLTSDLWATVFSVFAVGLVPSGMYFVALILVIVGIVVYEAGPSPIGHSTPSDIKVTMRNNMDSDETEHTTNIRKEAGTEGHVEMT